MTTVAGAKIYEERAHKFVRNRLKVNLFRTLTRGGMALFLRGRDVISEGPQVIGVHEPQLTALISFLGNIGYDDFLLDVGANIGLTSCQNGNSFRSVHMIEPNPYCCKIIEVNAKIAIRHSNYVVHNVGLGEGGGVSALRVPNNNWGGAFIKESNSYDANTLARKDNFKSLSDDNYTYVEIDIRNSSEYLSEIFEELGGSNLKSGLIKIDVEGYEPTVIKGIAESLPPEFQAFVVFESWVPELDMPAILAAFGGRATPYKLVRKAPWKKWPKVLKILYFLIANPKISYEIMENTSSDWSGDVILRLDKTTVQTCSK